ncbi:MULTISPECIES: transcription-repair coupling factor [Thiorhodovibrio]|uniref:transcription-repair coupling factor n=1 Tax=Thiorhodovibrio TaxID=61593 RepID=UPI001911EB34|nr:MULTISPECIES: transcription-repair coupling factor [Thiorhodovibrio]MBK5967986.1 transcription-repair coupling factor [Thiorhodovibrio winogradskyi]WPL11802.1 Transcription-repair-coupling factor [Thiorhodovibrio litoralis]
MSAAFPASAHLGEDNAQPTKRACSPLAPHLPQPPSERLLWGRLYGAAGALAIASAARQADGPLLVVVPDMAAANGLHAELPFFLDDKGDDRGNEEAERLPVWRFPDWETLPYDLFSPLPELVSERLLTLYRLPQLERGVLLAPVGTLMQRLPPRHYVESQALVLAIGDRLDLDQTRQRLTDAGYQCVSQVIAHGEFAVRGALLDIFPMGQTEPLRIDLFDDEIESIRTFDPDSQRSIAKLESVRMLPAREFPFTEEAISAFRQRYRASIDSDPRASMIYREVSEGRLPGGIEYYLPLFFDETATLFDYLPEHTLAFESAEVRESAATFIDTIATRFEQRCHDVERPILPPRQLYLDADELAGKLNTMPGVCWQTTEVAQRRKGYAQVVNFATAGLPPLQIQARAAEPAAALKAFVNEPGRRVLFVAESGGRRELLRDHLHGFGIQPAAVGDWAAFVNGEDPIAITVAPIEQPLLLEAVPEGGLPAGDAQQSSRLALITETQLYGERVRQERRRRKQGPDGDAVVRNLTELHPGAPVVHEDHGVGRFLGLQTLEFGGNKAEFLALEYSGGDKLYVPVSSLHLIARYTGSSPESAPLHKLGSDHWDRVKRKAAQKARDVAAELLDIYARRAARLGHAFGDPSAEYRDFAAAFEFEETPDQERAIESILADMADPKPMDRVVCGDVGFGKTEVAMRAAFVAANGGRQVAVLVPTTLLAQQHYQNFADRFADWPIRVESLSRFRSAKEVKTIIDDLAAGTVDIVVGTHKLLQPSIKFKNLGLAIIDEEHRFGVRHKEQLKSLRAEVDILTLTATPIPRTLNMSMAGLRDLSIIATPPVERHPIKTFTSAWNDSLIQEACQREINRGGQIYFLHNEVETIENMAQKIEALVPDARVQVAHGQMREKELERVMRDFYHRRFNLLVCTTIIESGIDVPSANTILINRADKLGLAQLHQLRGRVGRSHHRAYAYLITPPAKTMTADAKKRLEAIESLEDLGAGFTLATHDLEIRGAGELLGEEQSGQIHEVGFTLYMDLLERAVQALKAGRTPELDRPLDHGAEIDLGLPALLPDDYLPDIHTRLITYKRIASAADTNELKELKVEMIDRFGLLPEPAKNLFTITELKLKVQPHGIRKIEAGPKGGRILFGEEPKIDHMRLVQLIQSRPKEFKLDQSAGALRFYRDMPEGDKRAAQVDTILGQLTGQT